MRGGLSRGQRGRISLLVSHCISRGPMRGFTACAARAQPWGKPRTYSTAASSAARAAFSF